MSTAPALAIERRPVVPRHARRDPRSSLRLAAVLLVVLATTAVLLAWTVGRDGPVEAEPTPPGPAVRVAGDQAADTLRRTHGPGRTA